MWIKQRIAYIYIYIYIYIYRERERERERERVRDSATVPQGLLPSRREFWVTGEGDWCQKLQTREGVVSSWGEPERNRDYIKKGLTPYSIAERILIPQLYVLSIYPLIDT